MGGRRSIFGGSEPPQQQGPGLDIEAPSFFKPQPEAQVPPVPAQSIVEQLRVAEARKRNRPWDERQRGTQVSYRGIPKPILEAVRNLASSLSVSVDEAARACLEHGWNAYQSGDLELQPEIKGVRMTLYPEPNQAQPARAASKPVKRNKGKKSASARWQTVVSYRGIPKDLQEAIKGVAEDRVVPVGDVAGAFMQYTIGALETGRLQLKPVEQSSGNTLFRG